MNEEKDIKQFARQGMEMLDAKRENARKQQTFASEHKFNIEAQVIQYKIETLDSAMCDLRSIMRDFGINPYEL